MPFTISHAAAILPFSRPLARFRLLSAAVIGSMVPDFGLFMPWRPARVETHSAVSLLTFCLPVGLAVYWSYQRLIKESVVELLPDSAFERWQPFAAPADIGSVRQWLLAALGLLAGAFTHLVWDGFTHEGARGVRMIPLLDDPIIDIAGHHLVGARLLQDLSSLAGLGIVLIIMAYGLRRRPGTVMVSRRRLPRRERLLWVIAYAGSGFALSAAFLFLRSHSFLIFSRAPAIYIGSCAIAALRGYAVALIVVSLCLRVRLRTGPS